VRRECLRDYLRQWQSAARSWCFGATRSMPFWVSWNLILTVRRRKSMR
jgi:hypothetical protein